MIRKWEEGTSHLPRKLLMFGSYSHAIVMRKSLRDHLCLTFGTKREYAMVLHHGLQASFFFFSEEFIESVNCSYFVPLKIT